MSVKIGIGPNESHVVWFDEGVLKWRIEPSGPDSPAKSGDVFLRLEDAIRHAFKGLDIESVRGLAMVVHDAAALEAAMYCGDDVYTRIADDYGDHQTKNPYLFYAKHIQPVLCPTKETYQ